ncbi:MAG: hypothetical protein ACO1OO_11610 [Flavisolibacter sp.]
MQPVNRHPASYRDPAGYLFTQNGVLYRQVNEIFRDDFDAFISSGLYDKLRQQGVIVSHKEVAENLTGDQEWYKTLQPEKVPFISYPWEWCFDMWKDAAITTLEAAQEALRYNMMLKDASAYNLQWHQNKMLFIDTLSFEKYRDNEPWIAYRQFCEHFLAPLALMHYTQQPLQPFFLAYPDGLPLNVVQKLLPFRSRFNLHHYLHLHLPAKMQGKKQATQAVVFSRKKLENILSSLLSAVRSLHLQKQSGVWSGYYDEAAERDDYLVRKREIMDQWLERNQWHSAVDLGANEGEFSLITAKRGLFTISADLDHFSINNLYRRIKKEGINNLHPILLELSHPSPAVGLNNTERSAFFDRVNGDVVLALALIHHLCIGKNIPFEDAVQLFKKTGDWLIIEFVPKTDEKVQQMLAQKRDVYDRYTQEAFESVFQQSYSIEDRQAVGHSGRTLYLMKPKDFA